MQTEPNSSMATCSTPLSAFDPGALNGPLELGADGIWYAREREPVSYLEKGNEICFELEEKSFWFRHRSDCLCAVVRRFPPGGAIYDVGGGNGCVARALIDAGFEVVLVEPGEAGGAERSATRHPDGD